MLYPVVQTVYKFKASINANIEMETGTKAHRLSAIGASKHMAMIDIDNRESMSSVILEKQVKS
uniref:Uncharacterized protein n=1 Tax=mine drainage metagenome TaxID=410659 RepID=E6QIL6_9ZZZZ